MMLTPEQLRNIRDCANDGMPFNANTILMLCDHIDALQAQLQLANDCQEPLFDELAEKQARIAELEQCAARWPELVRDLIRAVLSRKKRAQQPASAQPVAVPEGWPTDDMVIRGAEQLHDSLRQFGCYHNFDADLNGTFVQQQVAESVFRAMLSASPKPEGGE